MKDESEGLEVTTEKKKMNVKKEMTEMSMEEDCYI